MSEEYFFYLREIGLTDVQIHIYDYILKNKMGTINHIKDVLNYSYAQVRNNLAVLEDLELIFSSKSKKNKKYYRMDPKIALTKVLNTKVKDFKEQIKKIDENIKIEESVKGVCVKNISFYHYSDVDLAIQNLFNLLENASKEVIMTALPPSLVKQLEPAFYNLFMKGIKLEIYFSNRDFDDIPNYFDRITDILNRIGSSIIQTIERTCQLARFNDIVVNVGNILIDGKYLNSVNFLDDDIFHFDGFYTPGFVNQAKKFLEIKTIEKKIRIEYPAPIQTVIDVIKSNDSISTRELSSESKIGGGKLREILDYLMKKGLIMEKEIKGDVGKPRKEYFLAGIQ